MSEEDKKALRLWTSDSTIRWDNKVSQDEDPKRYEHGYWYASYSILGEFDKLGVRELLAVLKDIEGRITGWPVWIVHNPKPYENGIECWIKYKDSAHSDYWTASPGGRLFLLRGYQEDSINEYEPGTVLDNILPVWRSAECLLHAARLAKAFNAVSASILFRMTWSGLNNRSLVSWARKGGWMRGTHVSGQNHVTSEIIVPVEDIYPKLPEIIKKLTDKLYLIFDFYEMPIKTIESELNKLRKKDNPRYGETLDETS